MLLSGVEGLDVSIEVAPLLYKLLVTVLAPALVGKVRLRVHRCVAGSHARARSGAANRAELSAQARPRRRRCRALQAARDLIPSVGRFATKYKQYLGMLSAVMLVMM